MDNKVFNNIAEIINDFDPQSGGAGKRKRDIDEKQVENDENPVEKKQKVSESQYRESRIQYIRVCNNVASIIAGILMITGMSGIYHAFSNTFDINIIVSNFANIIRTSSGLLSTSATAVKEIASSAFSGMGVQFATIGLIQQSRQADKSLLDSVKSGFQSGMNVFDYGINTTRMIKNKFASMYRGSLEEFDRTFLELQMSIANSMIDCNNSRFNEDVLLEYLVPLHDWLINGDFTDPNDAPVASSSCDINSGTLPQIMNEVQNETRRELLPDNNDVQIVQPVDNDERKEDDDDDNDVNIIGAAVKKKGKKHKSKKKKSTKKKKTIKNKSRVGRKSIKKKR